MANILVIGGRGYLGTELLPRLIAQGHKVRSASRTVPANGDGRVEWMRADIATGEGLLEAARGMDVIVHLASAGLGDSYKIDVMGTQHLLDVSKQMGIKHFVFISIVGIDKINYKMYQHKLAIEQMIAESGVLYSILRAPQFHSLVDAILGMLVRLPLIAVIDGRWMIQPIDEGEVAQRLTEIVAAGPSGRVPDIGGPEVRNVGEMARAWLAARGMKRLIISVPFPGALFGGWAKGLNTVPSSHYGKITWEQWLAKHYGSAWVEGKHSIRGEQSA